MLALLIISYKRLWIILLDVMLLRLWKTFNMMRTSQKQECNIWEINYRESEYLKYDGVM